MFELNLSDLREQFKVGETLQLLKPAKTGINRFKKGDLFEVLGVSEVLVDCINKDDMLLTLHRFVINEYVEKCNDTTH